MLCCVGLWCSMLCCVVGNLDKSLIEKSIVKSSVCVCWAHTRPDIKTPEKENIIGSLS